MTQICHFLGCYTKVQIKKFEMMGAIKLWIGLISILFPVRDKSKLSKLDLLNMCLYPVGAKYSCFYKKSMTTECHIIIADNDKVWISSACYFLCLLLMVCCTVS